MDAINVNAHRFCEYARLQDKDKGDRIAEMLQCEAANGLLPVPPAQWVLEAAKTITGNRLRTKRKLCQSSRSPSRGYYAEKAIGMYLTKRLPHWCRSC